MTLIFEGYLRLAAQKLRYSVTLLLPAPSEQIRTKQTSKAGLIHRVKKVDEIDH